MMKLSDPFSFRPRPEIPSVKLILPETAIAVLFPVESLRFPLSGNHAISPDGAFVGVVEPYFSSTLSEIHCEKREMANKQIKIGLDFI